MNLNLRSFMPSHIGGQIAIIIVASLLLIHVVLTTAFFLTRHGPPPQASRDELATLVELIAASPAPARAALVVQMRTTFPRFDLTLTEQWPQIPSRASHDMEADGLARRLGPNYRVTSAAAETPPGADGPHAVAIRLNDGQIVTARLTAMPGPPPFGPFIVTLIAIAVSSTLLGLWAAWRLAGPLRRFAWAAENFGLNGEIALLPERGPYEVRAAARALNQMRERIRSLIEDRTRMLAAVSHDLRTPITRLRLRCEFIEDPTARAQMLDELSHMGAMIESVLYFLRDGQRREKATMIDLATSLQTICDQFADTGYDVNYDGPDHVVICAYAEELHRAITNLIDNAVRHGGRTDVRVSLTSPTVTVAIEDDGPGIPETGKAAMFKPFVRGDTARGMNNQTGFGLGLSIARTVIEAHSGTLTLLDREPHGLIAKIMLPQSGVSADTADIARPH
jgi:signal transduction histidine kinase